MARARWQPNVQARAGVVSVWTERRKFEFPPDLQPSVAVAADSRGPVRYLRKLRHSASFFHAACANLDAALVFERHRRYPRGAALYDHELRGTPTPGFLGTFEYDVRSRALDAGLLMRRALDRNLRWSIQAPLVELEEALAYRGLKAGVSLTKVEAGAVCDTLRSRGIERSSRVIEPMRGYSAVVDRIVTALNDTPTGRGISTAEALDLQSPFELAPGAVEQLRAISTLTRDGLAVLSAPYARSVHSPGLFRPLRDLASGTALLVLDSNDVVLTVEASPLS